MEDDRTLQEKIEYLKGYRGKPLKLMEVCGTHTAGIFKSGMRSWLPPGIRLISGPGCPVCVTPTAFIDRCVEWALSPGCALVSFGDMLKVPGSEMSLADAKGRGARVEMVYSPFDIMGMAEREPEATFVLAAVGFETTAPAYALLMEELVRRGIKNVKMVTALKIAMEAIKWVCDNEPGIDGFLCPGHVSVMTGSKAYGPLAKAYSKPFVIAGFESRHLVDAVYELAAGQGRPLVSNLYSEAVDENGNLKAQEIIDKYFVSDDAVWRGLGSIAGSGLRIRDGYAQFDAGSSGLDDDMALPEGCRCADVITGRIDPDGCPMFGAACIPGHALGPCMVSSEGSCGIWYTNTR